MNPNLEALRDLLVKARAAEEVSRELDKQTAEAFGRLGQDALGRWCRTKRNGEWDYGGGMSWESVVPAYTTRPLDLTAVVGLMKEGWFWSTERDSKDTFEAVVYQPVKEGMSIGDFAPTPALALLIAVIGAHIYELESTT